MLIEKQSASDGSYVQCGVSWEGGNGAGLESRARTEGFVQEISSAVGSGIWRKISSLQRRNAWKDR